MSQKTASLHTEIDLAGLHCVCLFCRSRCLLSHDVCSGYNEFSNEIGGFNLIILLDCIFDSSLALAAFCCVFCYLIV